MTTPGRGHGEARHEPVWEPTQLPDSWRRRRTRLTRAGREAVTTVASRYAYHGRRVRQLVSPHRRWVHLTGLVGVARAAAPDGGYLAAVGRYVYRGRRSRPMAFALRHNARLVALGGAMLTAIVLATIVLAVNATVRPAIPSAEPALPIVPDYSYPPPDAEPTLIPPTQSPDPADPTAPTITAPAITVTPPPDDSLPVPTDETPGTAGPGATTLMPPRAPAPVKPPQRVQGPATNPTRSYEAEAAYLYGASKTTDRSASGGWVVRVPDGRSRDRHRASTGAVHFTRVSAAQTGRYAMTVFYLGSDSRDAAMLVNGRQLRTLRLPADGRTDGMRSATFAIDLVAGYNSITFGIPANRAPRLDRITVQG